MRLLTARGAVAPLSSIAVKNIACAALDFNHFPALIGIFGSFSTDVSGIPQQLCGGCRNRRQESIFFSGMRFGSRYVHLYLHSPLPAMSGHILPIAEVDEKFPGLLNHQLI
jgi:hypothetical protein